MGTRCWTGSSRWQSKENGLNREPAPDLWRQHRYELMLMFDVLKAFIEGIAVQLDVVERGVRSDFYRVKTTKAEGDRIQWGLPKFDTYLVWGFEMIYIRRKTIIMGKCERTRGDTASYGRWKVSQAENKNRYHDERSQILLTIGNLWEGLHVKKRKAQPVFFK